MNPEQNHSPDQEPESEVDIQPATTVAATFELQSGSIAFGTPGCLTEETLERCPRAGKHSLPARNGTWKVEVDAERLTHDIPIYAMYARAHVLDAHNQPVVASYIGKDYVISFSGMVGIFDSHLQNLESDQLFALASKSTKLDEANCQRVIALMKEKESARGLLADEGFSSGNLVPISGHIVTNDETETQSKPISEQSVAELLADTRELLAKHDKSLARIKEGQDRTREMVVREIMSQALGAFENGVVMSVDIGGGLFGVTIGRDLSHQVVSIEIDLVNAPGNV